VPAQDCSEWPAAPIAGQFTRGGPAMTDIQGWIVIALLVIVIFSQWLIGRSR
jgi:hypothetical protein